MKTTAIGAFLLLIMTLSCQSEYERQLAKGKDLVQKQITYRYTSPKKEHLFNTRTNLELKQCAQLSGNKRLFQVELEHYETNLQQRQVATKYP